MCRVFKRQKKKRGTDDPDSVEKVKMELRVGGRRKRVTRGQNRADASTSSM